MQRKREWVTDWKGRDDAVRRCGSRGLVVVLAVVWLSAATGCSRGEGVGVPSAKALLTVVPGYLSECAAYDGVAQVAWDASAVGASRVRVEVGQLGNTDSRVFYEGDGRSSVATGPWVTAGTVFILVDRDTGALLDSYEVKALPCL